MRAAFALIIVTILIVSGAVTIFLGLYLFGIIGK